MPPGTNTLAYFRVAKKTKIFVALTPGRWHGLVADHFRADKFRRPEQDSDVLALLQLPRQAEVDDFDQVRRLRLAQDVLRLQVEVDDVVVVHVPDGVADLPHEEDAVALRQGEVVGDHLLEELAAADVLHHHDHLPRVLVSGRELEKMLFNFLSSPSLTDLPNKPFQSSLIFESEAGADPSGALSTENNRFLLSYVEVFYKALYGLCKHSSLFVRSVSDE